MGLPNLWLRGSIYWFRRRFTVQGEVVPLALSLRTGIFYEARSRAGLLSAEVEKLRMAFGERGRAVDAGTLRTIFSDAARRQLDRILDDQASSPALADEHARENRIWAEVWRFLSANGAKAKMSEDEYRQLLTPEWLPKDRMRVVEILERLNGAMVSGDQMNAYANKFGFVRSAYNDDLVQRTVFDARRAACEEGLKRLFSPDADESRWRTLDLANEPEGDRTTDQGEVKSGEPTSPQAGKPVTAGAPSPWTASSPREDAPAPQGQSVLPASNRKLFSVAAKECIAAHVKARNWAPDSVEQVGTATRLFLFACGDEIAIEDLSQKHIEAFHILCGNMPNRWGKSKPEMTGGLPASIERAAQFRASGQANKVGFSQKTIDKHLTWIKSVVDFADDDGSEEGHRPAKPLRYKTKESKIASKQERKGKRARDDRSNWTKAEMTRLLEAPIWSGCKSLSQRFKEGKSVYHDAWYWLPLMYILYGGRSSELAALLTAEVFEDAAIPFFKVDYNDLRGLKNVQSIRSLPIHPELIRLGFIDYVKAMRGAGQQLLFPEMHSPNSKAFSATFYKSVFRPWRRWAFPNGTDWRHQAKGAIKDKDVHSFRGVAGSLMKGKVPDSVRFDILGHEGENTTQRVYDEEAALEEKLKALELISDLTSQLRPHPLKIRPLERQVFGARPTKPVLRIVRSEDGEGQS